MSWLGWILLAAQIAGSPAPGGQQPTRDQPAQAKRVAAPSASISGRVFAADTGKPLRRAHVIVTAAELSGGRGVTTDDEGAFAFTALPAGRYTVIVNMPGFISLSYGQRRPLQPGTPIQVADGQPIKGVDFRLPRGGVITGHVFDEGGDPIVGATVRVLRYRYQQGERRLNQAGITLTDDLGAFRVWGLNPGQYYVDAQRRNAVGYIDGPPIAGAGGAMTDIANGSAAAAQNGGVPRAFAPTYYPGVSSAADAQPVTLGVSQERSGIDFNLQLVPVAQIAGFVTEPTGSPSANAMVSLVPDAGRGGFAINYGARSRPDGTFRIADVPPGRYIVQARGNGAGPLPTFASQALIVDGSDVSDLGIALTRSAIVSGTVEFAGRETRPPNVQVRLSAISLEPSIAAAPQAVVAGDGEFIINGIPAGSRLIRLAADVPGWSIKSVVIDDRDFTDTPIDVRPGRELAGVIVTLTDKGGEITGTLTTDKGAAVTDYTLLAFTTERAFWNAQSRFIQTARPDQNGAFRIRGLPAATYHLVAIDPSEADEWFDPAYLEQQRTRATTVTLGDGETKTQDFRVTSPQ